MSTMKEFLENALNEEVNEKYQEWARGIRQEFIDFDQGWTGKAQSILFKNGYKKEAAKIDKYMSEIDSIIGKIAQGRM